MAKEPQQAFIPGTEPVKNAKVHNKAIALARATVEATLAKSRQVDCAKTLKAAMKKEGLSEYHYDRVDVTVTPSETIKATLSADQSVSVE